jgi:HEAT repeat protein
MKTSALMLCVMVLVIAASASAGDKTLFGSTEKYERAEATLLQGLASDNEGLRESAAYMLGELKSDRAVIPLMGILRCESCSTARIVAALALCRIGEPRGV